MTVDIRLSKGVKKIETYLGAAKSHGQQQENGHTSQHLDQTVEKKQKVGLSLRNKEHPLTRLYVGKNLCSSLPLCSRLPLLLFLWVKSTRGWWGWSERFVRGESSKRSVILTRNLRSAKEFVPLSQHLLLLLLLPCASSFSFTQHSHGQ